MLSLIQQKVRANPDGIFGRQTANAIARFYNLKPEHAAHILGQCGHETGGWRVFEENLNYSAEQLLRVFPKHFTAEEAKLFARKPMLIANKAYGGRMGNVNPNDGWNFRGRGALQLTGRNNYEAFGNYIKDLSILENPQRVIEKYCFESAMWFFDRNNLWRLCNVVDDESILSVSRGVNVGNPNSKIIPHGLQDRIKKTRQVFSWIAESLQQP